MMKLSENIQDRLDDLSVQGNELCDASKFDEAIQKWRGAMELLPEPRTDWEAYTWLSASIGDAQYHLGQFDAARDSFYDALNGSGGVANPFIYYRLGQSLVRLGDESRGLKNLLKAYMLDGEQIFFADDDGEEYLKKLQDNNLI